MNLTPKNLLGSFLLFFAYLCPPAVNANSYSFRPLTMDNGLSNFVVTSFFKDSIGFVWIGTDNSLDRFDGVSIKHYTFKTGDINKKPVLSIAESSSRGLFIGNGIGLWKLNKETEELIHIYSDQIDCGVNTLLWNPIRKELLIGTEKGLYIQDRLGKLRHIILQDNIFSLSNYITGIAIDKQGVIWLSTHKGIFSYNIENNKKSHYEFDSKYPNRNVFHKITHLGNTLYMGTPNAGIISFDISSSQFSTFTKVGSNIITDISSDGKDMLYVATDGNGVHFISHNSKKIVQSLRYLPNQKNSIRSNSVYSLLVDRNGVIWIGFYQAGLDYSLYQNNIFKTYSFQPYFNSKDLAVRTFLIREDEKMIGTREGLYFIQEKKNIVKSYTTSDLRSNLILSLCYYEGEYYIGTYGGGASVLNPKTLQIRPLSDDPSLLNGHIFHFEIDSKGTLWIASSGGLYSYQKDKNELKSFTSSNSQLFAGNVFYVFFDSTNKGWVATENGLCIYDPNTKSIQSNVFPKDFINKEIVKVIYEDVNQQLFFCLDKGDILTSDLNMKTFSLLEMTKRFKNRIFLSVIQDKENDYWFGSENGLLSMTGNDDTYHSFSFIDGIPDPVFSSDATFLNNDGKLWFGNAKGLLYVDPKDIKSKSTENFSVVFTDLQVNGKSLSSEDKLKFERQKRIDLKYNEDNFMIQFVSLLFTQPSTTAYEYKFEGIDTDWNVLICGQNEISFSDLSSGEYDLRVRIQGNKDSEASIHIKIQSFFGWEFWILIVLALSIIYFFGDRFVRIYKKLLNYKTNNESEIKQIGESLEDKHDEKYKYTKLTDEECKQICDKLNRYFDNDRPYINPNLKIVDLAQAVNSSSHNLSYIFNHYLNTNYYDFVNEYRVKEFKRLVEELEVSKYSISSLAEKCGFSSRAAFFRSFKKLTGITPNEYIHSVEKKGN